jgi:hypothetical protein
VPRHNVDRIIDIKDHSAANNSAPDIDESIVEADDLAQRRRILPARDGRLRAEVLAMSGRRPQATFRRDPSHVAHTVADNTRRPPTLARRWIPAFDAAIRGKWTTSNAAGIFLRETDGRRKLGWLSSVMAGYQDQRFAAVLQLAERRRTKGSTQVEQSAPKN